MAVAEERELYGVARDRFVIERTALARTLRAEGRRDDAQRVAKLAKPPLAAWVVNQLARGEPRAVAELLAAGERLARAQGELISGARDAAALREAGQRERAAVDALVTNARGTLSAAGDPATPATLARVAETLHAAALTPEVHEIVSAGCLDRELRHVGLGPDQGASARPAGKPRAKRQATHAPDGRAARGRASELADARRERERLEADRRAEADARRRSARAAREVALAEDRRDRAARALDDAERALHTARERAHAADPDGARSRGDGNR